MYRVGMGKAPSRENNVEYQGLSRGIGPKVKPFDVAQGRQAMGIPRSVTGENPFFDRQA
jgi:uncharacterized ferredoxin-like protein